MRAEEASKRKGISIIVAVLLLIIIGVVAGGFFYFWFSEYIKGGARVAEMEITISDVGYLAGEDYSGIPADPATLVAEHGCIHVQGRICHVIDTGTPADIVARCQLSGCAHASTADPPQIDTKDLTTWKHTDITTGIHPGDGDYEGREDCLSCHMKSVHNFYSAEEAPGACLKVGNLPDTTVSVCHESAAAWGGQHTTEMCLEMGCHDFVARQGVRQPHSAQFLVLYALNSGTQKITIADVFIDGKSARFATIPYPGYETSLTLDPGEKVALQLFGIRVVEGERHVFEVLTEEGVTSGEFRKKF